MLLTVNGTGVADPFGPGFSADVGRMVSDLWNKIVAQFWGAYAQSLVYWQPIGYAAAVFPMTPSVNQAVAELSRQVTLHENPDPNINLGCYCPVGHPLFLSGYSQGAIAVAVFWRDYVLNPKGLHHNRLDDIVKRGGIIQFGDPMRTPGVAHGNEVAGFAAPTALDGVLTGGIAGPGCLKPEETDLEGIDEPFYLSCALDGDLYGASPVGPKAGTVVVSTGAPWVNEPLVGQIQTRIYSFIESGSLLTGVMAVAKGIAQEFAQPLTNTIALVQAIFGGLKFAAAGTNAPHWQYQNFVPHMTQWVNNRARKAMAEIAEAA